MHANISCNFDLFIHAMQKLSVVIITLNEERNIGRCLASVQSVADEIVVVDSFSTDKTASICAEYGAQFIRNPFEGYIQQKQFALTQCTYDMVLSLDADEALSEGLAHSILMCKKYGFEHRAYTMNRLTNYCGQWIRYSGWYPDVKLRLFDRNIARWGGRNPHDKVELTDNSKRAVHLQGDLLHFSYYAHAEHIAQARRFAGIAANEMAKQGKKSFLLHAAAKALARFVKHFIIKRGFLDGRNGFIISKMAALETWWKYRKLSALNQSKQPA